MEILKKIEMGFYFENATWIKTPIIIFSSNHLFQKSDL